MARSSSSTSQTTLSSPPNTAFNLKTLLNSISPPPVHEPTTKTTETTRILLWLDATPLLIEIPPKTPLSHVTTFTAITINDNTTPSDIEDLLWGHLSENVFVTDTDQIESEAERTAALLPNAHTSIKQAVTAIEDAYELTETIERDITEFNGFHVAIEELSTRIEDIQSHLTTTQTILANFNSDLLNKDIKDSPYNETANVIISNCEQTATTITGVLDKLPSVTPDTLNQSFNSIRDRLDTIHSQLEQITERIEDLYTSATNEEIPTTSK